MKKNEMHLVVSIETYKIGIVLLQMQLFPGGLNTEGNSYFSKLHPNGVLVVLQYCSRISVI